MKKIFIIVGYYVSIFVMAIATTFGFFAGGVGVIVSLFVGDGNLLVYSAIACSVGVVVIFVFGLFWFHLEDKMRWL